MSRTIVTKSGTKFYTNVNSEALLGELCKLVGAKYFELSNFTQPKLAYSMTEEEALQASNKLRTLLGRESELAPAYAAFFDLGENTAANFRDFVEWAIQTLQDSRGYDCIG